MSGKWRVPEIQINRPVFSYVGVTQISIGGGGWMHFGSADQVVYINSPITHTITGTAVSDWQYIYIDDSAVVAAATGVLTGTEIINSITEPAWSDLKKGWYNGEDLCIFAVYEDGSGNVTEFFHDGSSFIGYADSFTDLVATDIDDAWVDVTLSMPSFATRAQSTFRTDYVNGAATLSWRTNGQTGTVGKIVTRAAVDATVGINSTPVVTDSDQIIEVIHSNSNSDTSTVFTDGFHLPAGM